MSEWNRRDRDEGQRRYGYEDQYRRGSAGRDRWSGGAEGRSGQRGYGAGGSYDERDQDGLSDYALGPYGSGQHPGESGQRYGGGRYGGGQGQGGQRYGGDTYSGRQGYSGQGYRDQGYSDQGYGGRSYGAAQQGYGRGDAVGRNERLQRVSDGEADRGHLFGGAMSQGGEHRGRGPKNYTRSDDRIREDVNDRLSDDSWLDAGDIDVQVSACEVTLTGTVNSRDDKRRAEDIAEQVSGVKHVQNNLRVQPASRAAGQGGAGAAASGQRSGTGAGGPSGSLQ